MTHLISQIEFISMFHLGLSQKKTVLRRGNIGDKEKMRRLNFLKLLFLSFMSLLFISTSRY